MSDAARSCDERARVLGIDPGTAVTGFGVIDVADRGKSALVECGVIRTSPRASRARRLLEIHLETVKLVRRAAPDVVSIEDVFHARNARSALTLGHARGAIIVAAGRCGVDVVEYSARAIKKAVVGTGAATKDQVAFMVRQHLRLRTAPAPADASDGVACALCHALIGLGPVAARAAAGP